MEEKVRLNNDTGAVLEEFGFDPFAKSLFTNIKRDSNKLVRPIIAELEDEKLLLVRQQETASVLFSGVPRESVRFHSEWVTFDRRIVEGYDVAVNLPELVAELCGGERVSLAPGISYGHLQELEKRVDIEVEPDPRDVAPVIVYELSEEAVLERIRGWRESGVEFGRGFATKFSGLDGIEQYLDSETDTRFSALTDVVARLGVAGLYLAAPPNFSEVTAHRDSEELGAVWVPGTGKVLVIAADAEYGFVGTPVGRYASRAEAVRALLPGIALGVEEDWITASLARSFAKAGLELTNASMAVASWRDLHDVEDLPFILIAARASTYAMENALSKLETKLQAGKSSSEAELYADYLGGIHDFRLEYGIPFAIEPYFVNLHASDRTLFPTTPTDATITVESGCIELDTGVKVTIDGVTLATSDMGRSLPLTSGASQAYDTLTRVVREQIIPTIRPGVPMSEVHAAAIDSLTAARAELEEAGLLDEDTDFVSWYMKRNVGHLMGKQESFANEFRPGSTHVLRVGDYGAAETPWRFGGIGISTEDLWFIGTDRTFTLTLGS